MSAFAAARVDGVVLPVCSAAFPNEASPLNLQLDMFAPTLESQTTEAQREQWCTKAVNHEILGTYAQTELGHGRRSTTRSWAPTLRRNSDTVGCEPRDPGHLRSDGTGTR